MLLTGIRVVSVSTIALVSVGVIIGSANLGYLFQNGKQRGILEEVVVGILISLLLALDLRHHPGHHRPAADAVERWPKASRRSLSTWASTPAIEAPAIEANGRPGRTERIMNLLLDALQWIFDPEPTGYRAARARCRSKIA